MHEERTRYPAWASLSCCNCGASRPHFSSSTVWFLHIAKAPNHYVLVHLKAGARAVWHGGNAFFRVGMGLHFSHCLVHLIMSIPMLQERMDVVQLWGRLDISKLSGQVDGKE